MATSAPTDTRYRVVWLPMKSVKEDEYGDIDLGRSRYSSEYFTDLEVARQFAQSVVKDDAWGEVHISRERIERFIDGIIPDWEEDDSFREYVYKDTL